MDGHAPQGTGRHQFASRTGESPFPFSFFIRVERPVFLPAREGETGNKGCRICRKTPEGTSADRLPLPLCAALVWRRRRLGSTCARVTRRNLRSRMCDDEVEASHGAGRVRSSCRASRLALVLGSRRASQFSLSAHVGRLVSWPVAVLECEELVFGACGIGCCTANSKSKALRRQLDVGPTRRPEHAILRSAVRRSDGGQGFVFRWFDSIRFSFFSRGKVVWASSRPGLFSNPIASRRRSSFTQ